MKPRTPQTAPRWPKYPKCRPSGVEWLGDVPEHWKVKRLKHVASINDEALSETTDPDFEFDYVDIGNVDSAKGIIAKEACRFADAPSRARRVVSEGDTIVSTVRTYLRAIAPIQKPENPLIVSTGFAVVRPRKIDPRYLSYALRSPYFVETVVSRSAGVSYPAINAPEVGNISILIPSFPEQRAIAAFLDRETARVDALVEKKRRQIELLQEKRSALISQAVTKGLDPEAPMKDSGVEWLGDVPEHWEVWKIYHAFNHIKSGTTPKSDNPNYYGGNIPWVNTSELRESVIEDTQSKITEAALNDCSGLHIYPAGTLLFALYGATIGRMGILGVPAAVNQACLAFVGPKHLTTKFTYYWLWMRRSSLIALSAGGGQPNLCQEDLREVRIPAPKVSEQEDIVHHIENQLDKMNPLVERLAYSIAKLHEYRAALISAATTGKIDVREEAER